MRYSFFALIALAGCVEAGSDGPLPVSDFNGNIVKVISHPYASGDHPDSPIWKTAEAMCQTVGKHAHYQFVKRVSQYQGEHTLLCTKQPAF